MILGATQFLAVMTALVLGVGPQQVNTGKTCNTGKTNTTVTNSINNIKPTGEYAKIDVQLAKDTINVLNNGTTKQKQATIKRITSHSDKYAPVVFYVLAKELYNQGNKDDAVFWYYAGDLRSRYDAQRSTDKTVSEGITVINNQYGTSIVRYATTNPSKLDTVITKVIDWDRKTPCNYDHRWVNLYGNNGVVASTGVKNTNTKTQPLSVPKSQWKQIGEKNRTDYVNHVHKNIENWKSQPIDAKAPVDNTL